MSKEKRILITKVSGECRYLRIIGEDCEYGSEGLYCAANPHSDWEKITKRTCKTCKREKFLTGISRQEAIERMAKAIRDWELPYICWEDLSEDTKDDYKNMAKEALNALLEGSNK